jgi:uncharacterized repeat protein (TIGR01451 family)
MKGFASRALISAVTVLLLPLTAAGLTLDKSAVQSTFAAAGQTLDYNYLVTNDGFAPLAGPVTVTDDKTVVACPDVSSAGDLDTFLDQGEAVTCTATYVVTAGDVANGFVTNTASAAADGVTSNTDSVTVNLLLSADLAISKFLQTSGPFSGGQLISYQLFFQNIGPSDATLVQITDTPSNLTITDVSGGGCVALPCTLPSFAAGANASIFITARIDADAPFDNAASVSAAEADPDNSNNTDDTGNGGVAAASADLAIQKFLNTSGPFVQGQTVSYLLFVGNGGPSTATSVQITDTPSNLTITRVSGDGCTALPCTLPSLAVGANASINVEASINAAGPFDNAASIAAAEPDPDGSNNADNAENGGTAAPAADVSVVKTLTTGGPFTPGQSVSYTLVVSNAGPSAATSIQVTDTPSNLTITNVSGGCATLPCTIATLAAGAGATINVTATINTAGAFDNVAAATAAESDPDPADNTDGTGNGGFAAFPDQANIPTATGTGLMLLAIALAGVAVLRMSA